MKKYIWIILCIILGIIIVVAMTMKPNKDKIVQTSSGEVLNNTSCSM